MNESKVQLKEEVHRIVGCAMEVSNVLGHGLLENGMGRGQFQLHDFFGLPGRRKVDSNPSLFAVFLTQPGEP